MGLGGAHSVSHCTFTVLSFLLGAIYLVILLLVIRHLRLLLQQEKRKAQKIFLTFVTLQCLGRCIYFIAWPLAAPYCVPSVKQKSDHWSDILGVIPGILFLSGFTVLTYTFARIYHTVLRFDDPLHAFLYSFFVVFHVSLNLAMYVTSILQLSGAVTSDMPVLMISVSAFIIAGGFLLYGVSLYFDVKSILQVARQQQGVYSSPHIPRRPKRGEEEEDVNLAQQSSQQLPKNPMLKIAVVASVCMLCFLTRSFLLPVMDDHAADQWVTMIYFVVSEVIPLCLMLHIFDTKAASGTHAQAALRPVLLMSGRRAAEHAPLRHDRSESHSYDGSYVAGYYTDDVAESSTY